MPKYVAYGKVRNSYDVSSQTIKNWALRGAIEYKTIQNKDRKTWLYNLESIGDYISKSEDKLLPKQYNRIIYTRVSSKKQESDLQRQCNLLQYHYPEATIIKDIGSGLNFKRIGFNKLLSKIFRGEVDEIVVTFKDRLLRFGYELFEKLCHEFNCKIVVFSINNSLNDIEESETQELQEDLLSIVNVFVARRNGKRAGLYKQERKKERDKLINENTLIS